MPRAESQSEYKEVTEAAYAWYMAERSRTQNDAADHFRVLKSTLSWRFRKLGLKCKSNSTHHYEDLQGRRFDRCVVIRKLPRKGPGGVRWLCLCDCGKEFESLAANLKAKKTKGCGCGRRGPKHGCWNPEGYSIAKSGYAFVRRPEHSRSNRAGWVREHIVVMERLLERALEKGEEVHHKNGIRHDNSKENLELWNKSHPSGSRVEDLVEYSLKILRLYKPEALERSRR